MSHAHTSEDREILEIADRIGRRSRGTWDDDVPLPPEPPSEDVPPSPGASARETTPARPDSTWRPIDLAALVGADYAPTLPTVGERSDGRGILYAGRTHTLSGESEAKKSWAAQLITLQELGRGHGVVYIDFEDDAASVARRLLLLGAPPQWLTDRFGYISPDEPITSGRGQDDLRDALNTVRPTLVVLDGVTEALSLHGLSTIDNDDLAKFGRLVTRPLATSGAAVLSLDHVTKATDNRGRYALGGVHKLNAVTGAAFSLENIARSGEGLAGRSRLLITKDRPGQLRNAALPGSGDRWWFADFTLDSTRQPEPAEFVAPAEHTTAGPFRPTALMTRVAEALAGAPEPLTTNDITARVKGRRADIATAIAALVDDGHIQLSNGQRGARLHTLIQPYPAEGDDPE